MNNSFHWYWEKAGEEVHLQVWGVMEQLLEDHRDRLAAYEQMLSLYMNREVSLDAYAFSEGARRRAVTINIVQSCIDTLASRICSVRPRPQFLTDGGEWEISRRAKKLDKFVEGLFYEQRVYTDVMPRVFYDACVFGTGFAKVVEGLDGKSVKIERVFPYQVFVDERACAFGGQPRSIYQRQYVPADILVAHFPDFKDEIRAASNALTSPKDDSVVYHDLVEVVEAWHLRSSEKSKDGRHALCIKSATLYNEEWSKDRLPFCVYRWARKPYGFYGQGLCEQLEGFQLEENKLLGRIQDAMHLFSVPMVFSEKGSVTKGHMKNVPGVIIEYTGKPPAVQMPSSVNGEVFGHIDRIYARAYEIAGVSQLSAQSKKPSGVESGVAMRTILDVETQRFGLQVRDWEQAFLDLADLGVDVARDVYGRSGRAVKWRSRDYVETIKWSDVDMPKDTYVLQLYPTAMLPREPAGRIEMLQMLMQLELISKREASRALDFPDLRQVLNLATASLEDIDMVLDRIVEHGELIEPTPYQNLEEGIARAQSFLLRCRADGAPDDTLEMIAEWIEKAQTILDQAQPPALAPEGPPPAMEGPPAPMPIGPAGPVPNITPPPGTEMNAPPVAA